jgi:hypothetical protein
MESGRGGGRGGGSEAVGAPSTDAAPRCRQSRSQQTHEQIYEARQNEKRRMIHPHIWDWGGGGFGLGLKARIYFFLLLL